MPSAWFKRIKFKSAAIPVAFIGVVIFFGLAAQRVRSQSVNSNNDTTSDNAAKLISQGRQIFRFDTFGDQAYWGDTLRLHQAIEGSALGGVGPGLSPKAALSVGLKVDADALPGNLLEQLQHGMVRTHLINLNRSISILFFSCHKYREFFNHKAP
jgi:hypothetical protein